MQTNDVFGSKERVLVTGASGYVALHCVQQLLEAGYIVRGTVRDRNNEKKVSPLKRLSHSEHLELVEADLLVENNWTEVIDGCSYVLHVASPWPIVADEKTIETAVTGTLTVLRAAAQCKCVKKVVLTSSCAAINDGHDSNEVIFDETFWSNLSSPKVECYSRSKTLAERKAWDFWNSLDESSRFEFTVLNPTLIFGAVLSDVENGSCTIISRMMHIKTYLAAPKVSVGLVDVRDVARAHVLALKNKESNGERILIHAQSGWFADISRWLFKEFRLQGYPITVIEAPKWMVKCYAALMNDPMIKTVIPRIGPQVNFDNSKSKRILGMTYTNMRQSVIEMMYSMIEIGMYKKTRGYIRRQLALQEKDEKKAYCQ